MLPLKCSSSILNSAQKDILLGAFIISLVGKRKNKYYFPFPLYNRSARKTLKPVITKPKTVNTTHVSLSFNARKMAITPSRSAIPKPVITLISFKTTEFIFTTPLFKELHMLLLFPVIFQSVLQCSGMKLKLMTIRVCKINRLLIPYISRPAREYIYIKLLQFFTYFVKILFIYRKGNMGIR